jgi:pimeloyl-ACP methyl ester carboxylesterase
VGARRKVIGVAASVAVGTAVEVARRKVIAAQNAEYRAELGSLRGRTQTVIAADGVPLHIEVDESIGAASSGSARLTLVFVHGYALSLNAWHFQRWGYRGQIRTVYYDHRSHGRSGRALAGSSTMPQLADDLLRVIEQTTGDDPVVLIGHSMGGMTILQLAADYPELFGNKVVGAALVSTTAGHLHPAQIVLPVLPRVVSAKVGQRIVNTLRRIDRVVDTVRHLSDPIGKALTDTYSFGSPVPQSYTNFVFDMVDRTPFEVVAEFYPAFTTYDVWGKLAALSSVPTTIIAGVDDKLTKLVDSRRLHAEILGSELLELGHAGHMAFIEHHAVVNNELDQLIARAQEKAQEGAQQRAKDGAHQR